MDQTRFGLGGAARDLRIDFFRGLALYMIIFDHIAGDPLSRLTYARLGFSDAAEIFVFLSGVSCGIVYSRLLSRQGVGGLLRGVSWRALQIYTYYLIASLVTILVIAAEPGRHSNPRKPSGLHHAARESAGCDQIGDSFDLAAGPARHSGSLSRADAVLDPNVSPHRRAEQRSGFTDKWRLLAAGSTSPRSPPAPG